MIEKERGIKEGKGKRERERDQESRRDKNRRERKKRGERKMQRAGSLKSPYLIKHSEKAGRHLISSLRLFYSNSSFLLISKFGFTNFVKDDNFQVQGQENIEMSC